MKSKRKPPRLETRYHKSLNAIVDKLFNKAFDMRLTWVQMAELSGLSRETIHKLGSRQTRLPQFRTIELLAHALGGQMEFVKGVERKEVIVKWTPKVFKGRRRVAA